MDSNLEALLNQLGEAERAGGRVLHELAGLADSLDLKELLKKVEHDEGYYAGQLAAHVRRLGGNPSSETGDFVEKVRAVSGLGPKLELLNRGQGWVVRKIDEMLPSVGDPPLVAFLRVMAEGHRLNISTLAASIKHTPA
jgi:Domain of unknown function (DUF6306)